MTKPIWTCKKLDAGFNPVEGLLKKVDLEVRSGERVAVLGSECSGVPLLLKVLSGLRPYRGGVFEVLGTKLDLIKFYEDWDHLLTREQRIKFGVALEEEGLLANVSLKEGLETVLRFGFVEERDSNLPSEMVKQVLGDFDLKGYQDLRPHQLSSTQRRFASLARATLLDPDIYLFEGVSKNVEDRDRELLFVHLERILKNKNKTMLLATEDWSLAMKFCERVLVFENGHKVFDGTWSDLKKSDSDYWKKIIKAYDKKKSWDEEVHQLIRSVA